MATKSIAWESGSGYISLSYTGTGNGSISITSDANDSFEDRQQTVRIATSTGSPAQAVELLIKQNGKSMPAGTVSNFAYTGTVQEVTLPKGKYKLQCWGAQGGTSSSGSATGSKGGYSEGVLTLTQTTKLYIFVGGQGASSGNGGWNGGGGASGSTSYDSGGTYGYSKYACGGGATDICTVTSDMSYSSKRNNRSAASLLSRCIVAGGGAGGSYRYTEVTTESSEYVYYTTKSGTAYSIGNGRYLYQGTLSASVGETYSIDNVSPSDYTNAYLEAWDSSGNAIGYGSTLKVPSKASVVYVNVFYKYQTSLSVEISRLESTSSTSTSSGKSNGGQQGGGTSGRGQYPGTQTAAGSNGAFGFGANQTASNYRYSGGAGGGGWYGGGSAYSDSSTGYVNYSGGGSGFVNTSANASSRPSGYNGLQLDSGTTTAGNASFPSTSGGTETGHSGNGYAKIIRLNDDGTMPDGLPTTPSVYYKWTVNNGTWNEGSNSEAMDGVMYTCVSPGTSGSTVIRCTFSGVSSITFRCRYQGESSYDYLTVGNLDASCTRSSYGTSMKGTSGTWKDITFNVSDSGEHYVEFCYSKDGSVDTSPDNADVMILSVIE